MGSKKYLWPVYFFLIYSLLVGMAKISTERNTEGERGTETNGTLVNSASDLGSSDCQNDLEFLPRIMFPAHIQPS